MSNAYQPPQHHYSRPPMQMMHNYQQPNYYSQQPQYQGHYMNQMSQHHLYMNPQMQMQQMWPQQAMQQHPIDQAPHRRIIVKGKDANGNSRVVRSIQIFYTTSGLNNTQVMAQIQQAEIYAEQGEAQKVTDLLMPLQQASMIVIRE